MCMKDLSLSEKLYNEVKSQFEKNYHLSPDFSVVLAVSGGADSMVLFHLLNRLRREVGFKLYALTVNHNIRPKEESLSDVMLVKKFANQLDVELKIHEFQSGYIENVRLQRKKGIEEAARHCRYKVFSDFAKEVKSDCVCLAHNQNDNLETLLQRFLQGSVLKSGIKNKRDIYFRPMLNISRSDIEAYAFENQIEYCIDSTNLENNYLRNKIRNQLMPVLDSFFDGWQSGVLAAGEKLSDVEKLIENSLKDLNWNVDFDNGFLYFDFGDFSKLDKSLKINFLYKGLESYFHLKAAKNPSVVAEFVRFPYQLLEKFVADYQSVDFEKIFISKENQNIFIGKEKKGYDNKGFYTIIDNVGLYDLDFGQILVEEKSQNRFVAKLVGTDYVSGEFLLPVVIRSKDDSDLIEDKNKNKKNVTKIFSEWKVLEEHKNCIPIFSDVKIRGIWGEPFRAENFFVKIDEEL